MKKILMASAALFALSAIAPATAADLAARPYTKAPAAATIYDWTGFYVGANGGWGSSHDCWTNNAAAGVATPPVTEGCHDASGGTAGGQIGYRWQTGTWVFGVEAQGNWADLSGRNDSLAALGVSNQTKIDAFGLFTGQIGYVWNNTLVYVKGGGALTDNKYQGLFAGTGVVIDRATETRWGGSIGAGFEYGFAPNWSVGVEYDHMFMGRDDNSFTAVILVPGLNTRTDSIRQDVDLATVRVNYRFGGPALAKF
jgi:outer membrane immunogenic protein